MSGKNVSIPLGQYIWVVKVCHNIWVTNLKGENFQGVQKKLGGIFQGGKKVTAVLTIKLWMKMEIIKCLICLKLSNL